MAAHNAPTLLSSGTTPARAALEFGTDDFAPMSRAKLRRVYLAACAAFRANIDDGQNAIDYVKETAERDDTARAAISESAVYPVGGINAVAHTSRIVSQLVSELCEKDSSYIPASPETREWDSFEGGYKVFDASAKTSAIIARVMAA